MSEAATTRRIGVFANESRDDCAQATAQLRQELGASGFEVVDSKENGDSLDGLEVLVLLGGDGFLMETLERFDYPTVPIFGVNFGTVGFHMNPQSTLGTIPESIRENSFRAETHPILEAKVKLLSGETRELFAFNDFVLERQTRQAVRLSVWLDGGLFNEFAGDGFVVASVAGSTAYNLAAGGPVVHPKLDAMILTPLYPHAAVPFKSVQFSTAVPLDSSLRFRADDLPKRRMRIVADGRPLEDVEEAEIFSSGRRITLLRSRERGFLETLSKKIIGE